MKKLLLYVLVFASPLLVGMSPEQPARTSWLTRYPEQQAGGEASADLVHFKLRDGALSVGRSVIEQSAPLNAMLRCSGMREARTGEVALKDEHGQLYSDKTIRTFVDSLVLLAKKDPDQSLRDYLNQQDVSVEQLNNLVLLSEQYLIEPLTKKVASLFAKKFITDDLLRVFKDTGKVGGQDPNEFFFPLIGERVGEGIAANNPGVLTVWEADKTIKHRDMVFSAKFNKDGDRVVTALHDHTAKILKLLDFSDASFDQMLLILVAKQCHPAGEPLKIYNYPHLQKIWEKLSRAKQKHMMDTYGVTRGEFDYV